jgi:hypothetical protein
MRDLESTATTILATLIMADKLQSGNVMEKSDDLCDKAIQLAEQIHNRCPRPSSSV